MRRAASPARERGIKACLVPHAGEAQPLELSATGSSSSGSNSIRSPLSMLDTRRPCDSRTSSGIQSATMSRASGGKVAIPSPRDEVRVEGSVVRWCVLVLGFDADVQIGEVAHPAYNRPCPTPRRGPEQVPRRRKLESQVLRHERCVAPVGAQAAQDYPAFGFPGAAGGVGPTIARFAVVRHLMSPRPVPDCCFTTARGAGRARAAALSRP